MRVCDACGEPININELINSQGLALMLNEFGDYCKECIEKIDSFLKGKAVIITKEEFKEFQRLKDNDRAVKELIKDPEVKPQ